MADDADDRDQAPGPAPGPTPDPTPGPAAAQADPTPAPAPAPAPAPPPAAAPQAPAPAPAPADDSPWAAPRPPADPAAGPPWAVQGYPTFQPPAPTSAPAAPSLWKPAATASVPRWQSWVLLLVAVVSCAALGLGTLAVVEARDSEADASIDVEELAADLIEEVESSYSSEEFGSSTDLDAGLPDAVLPPDFTGPEGGPFSMAECYQDGPATGPGLGPQPRSPDELNPVLAVGEPAVVSYRPVECEQPIVFRIRVDDVQVHGTAPDTELPAIPQNGTYVVVEATIELLNDCMWPDWYSFSVVGPDQSIVSPLFSEELLEGDSLCPGDTASVTLVFDAPRGHDLILFDDYVPGTVGWRF